MELLEVCLRTTYFQVMTSSSKKDGMPMGNAVTSVVSNIYMENFEELTLIVHNCGADMLMTPS
jgi:hypothetical protein